MDHYKILELPRTATIAEIKANYIRLSKQYNQQNKNQQEFDKFKKINEAFKILYNPKTKEQYDKNANANVKINTFNDDFFKGMEETRVVINPKTGSPFNKNPSTLPSPLTIPNIPNIPIKQKITSDIHVTSNKHNIPTINKPSVPKIRSQLNPRMNIKDKPKKHIKIPSESDYMSDEFKLFTSISSGTSDGRIENYNNCDEDSVDVVIPIEKVTMNTNKLQDNNFMEKNLKEISKTIQTSPQKPSKKTESISPIKKRNTPTPLPKTTTRTVINRKIKAPKG